MVVAAAVAAARPLWHSMPSCVSKIPTTIPKLRPSFFGAAMMKKNVSLAGLISGQRRGSLNYSQA